MLTDYHVHLRPDERECTAAEYFTAGNVERYRAAADEHGIAELGVAEHIYRFAAALEVWEHPFWRQYARRRPRRLLRLRARGDRPAPGHRGRLRPGPRGPDGERARGARLGLRRRLGALPARPLAGHRGLLDLGQRRVGREDLAPLLRDDRRVGALRALRRDRPSRPGQGLGRPRAAARQGPPLLLRARRRGVRGGGGGGRGLHRGPAQARRRALPGAAVPGDDPRRGLPDRALQRRARARTSWASATRRRSSCSRSWASASWRSSSAGSAGWSRSADGPDRDRHRLARVRARPPAGARRGRDPARSGPAGPLRRRRARPRDHRRAARRRRARRHRPALPRHRRAVEGRRLDGAAAGRRRPRRRRSSTSTRP